MRIFPFPLEPAACEPCPGRRREAEPSLYDHLRDALAAQRLAADKGLALDAGKKVGNGSQAKEHSSRDQARGGAVGQAQPLDDAHDSVSARAHVVGLDFPDVGIERAGGRADSKQQRDLDKQDDEGRHSAEGAGAVSHSCRGCEGGPGTGRGRCLHGNDAHDAVPDTQSEGRSDDVGQS